MSSARNMRKRSPLFCIVLISVLAQHALSQASSTPVYVESFRRGPTRITESAYEFTLDGKQPRWKTSVTDGSGRERYVLTFVPQVDDSADGRFLSWNAALADSRHPMYRNVLVPSLDPSQDSVKAWWFNPSPYAAVNLRTPRVVKVENFYCSFQVTDFRLARTGGPWLAAMKVNVRLTNTDPRMAVQEKH
jgi:hypothetical protein